MYIASTLTKLRHVNVLQFIGATLEAPQISLVTELMPFSLHKYYNSKATISYDQKVNICKGIANAMMYVSDSEDSLLTINTRLSSHNVLIGHKGEVKVCDFMSSMLYDSNRTLTSVNSVTWTAPEVVAGDVHKLSSVYSFGIIMWEIYTRKTPFEGVHPIRLLSMIDEGFRPEIPNDCPNQYSNLMKECWKGNAEFRPTWSEVVSKLQTMY